MIYRDREREERAVRDGVFRFYKSVGPVAGGWKEDGRRREEGGGGMAGGRRRGGSSQGQPRPRKQFFRFFECYIFRILYYTSVMVLYHTRSQLLYISYGVQLPSELLIVHSFQTTGQVYFESHVFGYLRYLYVTE